MPPYSRCIDLKVCEEKLQYSLSENVQTNVLWGSTITDSVILHPWAETSAGTATAATSEEASMRNERFVVYTCEACELPLFRLKCKILFCYPPLFIWDESTDFCVLR